VNPPPSLPSPTNGKLLFWNCNGVTAQKTELELLLLDEDIGIVLLNETHLKPKSKLKISQYTTYRTDRVINKQAAGGTAILIKNNIKHHEIVIPALESLEATGIQAQLDGKLTTIIAAYKRPQIKLVTKDIELLLRLGKRILIAGDLNCKHSNWHSRLNNANGKLLLAHSNKKSYSVIAPFNPTFYSYNLKVKPDVLDVALVKNINLTFDIKTLTKLNSDHLPVLIDFEAHTTHNAPRLTFNYKKADWDSYRTEIHSELDKFEAIKSTQDLDSHVTRFTEVMQTAMHNNIPLNKPKSYNTVLPKPILDNIKLKDNCKKVYLKVRNPALKTIVNRLTKQIKTDVAEHNHSQWESKVSQINPQDRSLWRLSGALTRKAHAIPPLTGVNGIAYTDSDKANVLADTLEQTFQPNDEPKCNAHINTVNDKVNSFLQRPVDRDFRKTDAAEIKNILKQMHPKKAPGLDNVSNTAIFNLPIRAIDFIAYIINNIMLFMHFPSDMKMAKILAFPKPNKDHKLPGNHRPISLLSAISKITEKVILARLLSHFKAHDTIRNEQFGFKAKHSTDHQLIRLTEHVTKGFGRGQVTGAVFLDVEKAFDRVWHEGLLCKLIDTLLPARYVHLIKSYLINRSFVVSVKNELSSIRPIAAGVPQGSILGPVLFNIFINDIPKPCNAEIGIYADDTVIYESSRQISCLTRRLQEGLDDLQDWYQKWRVKINVAKSEAILFTGRRPGTSKPTTRPQLFGLKIDWKPVIRYLGVHLDTRLTFGEHVNKIKGRAYGRLAELYPLLNQKSALSKSKGLLLYKTLIRPIMSFAPAVWGGADKRHIRKLQIVQNKVLRIIAKAPRGTRNDTLHSELNVEPIIVFAKKLATKFYDKATKSTNPLIKALGQYNTHHKAKHKRPKAIFNAQYDPLYFK
jgi:Reverse transcriptase (RNA-dependent DNA polymerase)/Endonuclease-reverse transcriptase